MRIYVAGASKEPERVRAAMTAVQMHGHTLTLDWLAEIEAAGAANEGLSDDDRRRYAEADLCAVANADVVWLLAPEAPSAGCWVELGYAMAWRPLRIVVSGPARERCIFAALADVEVDDDAEALRAICAWAGEGR